MLPASGGGSHEPRLARDTTPQYFQTISAVEVIEEFKKLPTDEQVKVKEFVNASSAPSPATPKRAVDEEFKKVADQVFTKNAELFRKLAQ